MTPSWKEDGRTDRIGKGNGWPGCRLPKWRVRRLGRTGDRYILPSIRLYSRNGSRYPSTYSCSTAARSSPFLKASAIIWSLNPSTSLASRTDAAYTTLPSPAQDMAALHIGQGSEDVYSVQSDSSMVPRAAHALRIATISPWAVGSVSTRTRLCPFPTISPLRTMTQPNGPPWPARIPMWASSTAILKNFSSGFMTVTAIRRL